VFENSVGRNCSDITVSLQVRWTSASDDTRMPSLNVCVQITMFGLLTSKSFADIPLIKSHSSAYFFFFILSSFPTYGTLDKYLSLLATRQVKGTAHLYGSVCYLSHRDLFCVSPHRFYSAVRRVTCLVTFDIIREVAWPDTWFMKTRSQW